MRGPDFLALYFFWLVVTRAGVAILRRQGLDHPGITLGGVLLYVGLGALRMWMGSANGLHRWEFLTVMMIGGAFTFLLRAKDFGNRPTAARAMARPVRAAARPVPAEVVGAGVDVVAEAAAELRRIMTMIGVGYRAPLAGWIDARPCECLEITAEHFYVRDEERLRMLAANFSLFVHGLGLSLGTPGRLDPQRLERFARVVEVAQPAWISGHVAFTRTSEVDLGHLNPVLPTKETARVIAKHGRELSERCGRPLILENITSYLRIEGELSETDFLSEVCERGDCGILLDVTNLFINSRNHDFDPFEWFWQLDRKRIRQLHIVGYGRSGDRYVDGHGESIQEELVELARAVVAHAPVESIILERDADFPGDAEMQAELAKLKRICGHA